MWVSAGELRAQRTGWAWTPGERDRQLRMATVQRNKLCRGSLEPTQPQPLPPPLPALASQQCCAGRAQEPPSPLF